MPPGDAVAGRRPRPRGDLPEVPGEGPAPPVPVGQGAGRRPRALARRRADRGAAGGPARPGPAMVPPQPADRPGLGGRRRADPGVRRRRGLRGRRLLPTGRARRLGRAERAGGPAAGRRAGRGHPQPAGADRRGQRHPPDGTGGYHRRPALVRRGPDVRPPAPRRRRDPPAPPGDPARPVPVPRRPVRPRPADQLGDPGSLGPTAGHRGRRRDRPGLGHRHRRRPLARPAARRTRSTAPSSAATDLGWSRPRRTATSASGTSTPAGAAPRPAGSAADGPRIARAVRPVQPGRPRRHLGRGRRDRADLGCGGRPAGRSDAAARRGR